MDLQRTKGKSQSQKLTRCVVSSISSFFFLIFIFQRQSVSRGGADREGVTASEAGSRLRAVSTDPDAGLELMNREIMT